MKIKKVEDGLLELDNYFIETPISDLLGEFRASKTSGVLSIYEGNIERPFPHNEYVILADKEETDPNRPSGHLKMYTRINDKVYGLLETGASSYNSNQWKLIRYNGFIQGYIKEDNIWKNMGGADVKGDTEFQGFSVEKGAELNITNYQVYSSPYISIFNVPEGYTAQAFNTTGETIFEKRAAQVEGLIELYVEDMEEGYIELYDEAGELIHTTETTMLKYGDKYMVVDYELKWKYKERILDYNPTKLDRRKERVSLVNYSDHEDYKRLLVSVYNPYNTDDVKISLDDKTYDYSLKIPLLEAEQERDVYIKINRKSTTQGSISMNKFALELDEY